jgi:hypothetical protein
VAVPCPDCGTPYIELFTSRYCPRCEPDEAEEITLEYDMDEILWKNARDCDHEKAHEYEYDAKIWCRACGTFLRNV